MTTKSKEGKKESRLMVDDDLQTRFENLKNECVLTLGNIVFTMLKRANGGKDPTYGEMIPAYYSIYAQFSARLLLNLDDALKQFDSILNKESPP